MVLFLSGFSSIQGYLLSCAMFSVEFNFSVSQHEKIPPQYWSPLRTGFAF